MDNEQNNRNLPEENTWSEEIIDSPKELGPDEAAVQSAGLTHPDDLELEQILRIGTAFRTSLSSPLPRRLLSRKHRRNPLPPLRLPPLREKPNFSSRFPI